MGEDLETNAKRLVQEAERNQTLAESEITAKIKMDKALTQLAKANTTIEKLEKDVSRMQTDMYESAIATSKTHENEKIE